MAKDEKVEWRRMRRFYRKGSISTLTTIIYAIYTNEILL